MSTHLVYWVNDRNPSISDQLTSGGVPVDISSATVTFKMRGPLDGTHNANVKVSQPANLHDSQGNWRYDWLAGDLDTAGEYLAWLEVNTGKVQTLWESIVEVRAHSASNLYVELEQVKSSLELTGTTYADQDILAAVNAACRAIDDACDRRFYLDADANQVRYYDILSMDLIHIDDLVVLTSLLVDEDGDGTFEQTWTQGSDFILGPYNAAAWGRPYTKIRWQPTGRFVFISPYPKSVKVTGQFGWPSVPAQVQTAATILTGRLVKRIRETPLGVMGVGIEGMAVNIARTDADVQALLTGVARRGGGLIV